MAITVTLVLSPKEASDEKYYIPAAAKAAHVSEENIALARVIKRSVDARRGALRVNLTLELYVDQEAAPPPVHFDYPDVSTADPVVIAGSGPAGLFAALRLIELGLRPIILERGKPVAERKKDIAQINRNGEVNPDSNYAFGEGGAGTFSDGKLSKKRGDYNKALRTLVFHGADPSILYEAHPHIGTDRLPAIMTAMRETITGCGGTILFNQRVTDIIVENSQAKGLCCGDERIEGRAVILATGHSAKDIYTILHDRGVALEAKPFAMGVRVEHPQELIDRIQYHGQGREYLPAAEYSLTAQVGDRGVYSFCMCPGGFIVPAMTHQSESVVNGMSPSGRNSLWANSGIVTQVKLSDFEHLRPKWGELAGLKFQQEFEMAARAAGGDHQIAPAQRLTDFVEGRASSSLPRSSYVPGLAPSRLDQWMPEFISSSLREGFRGFAGKMRGYLTSEALIVGVESRTSTPVRIPREAETLQHPQISHLYPAGEGAGYAGGIISAALDGERIAAAVAAALN